MTDITEPFAHVPARGWTPARTASTTSANAMKWLSEEDSVVCK